MIDVYESLSVAENINTFLDNLNVSVYEEVTTTEQEDIVRHLSLSIGEDISVTELFGDGNVYAFDSVSASEWVSLYVPPDFAQFLRTYPFVEVTLSNIEKVSFGGGYAQMLDWWGRTKKRFNINIAISHWTEILPVRTFYENNYGSAFNFTNPLDSVEYSVVFVEDSFRLERIAYDTYIARVSLEEWL